MAQYEYRVSKITNPLCNNPQIAQGGNKALNQLGAQGFEVISFTSLSATEASVLVKRVLPDEGSK